MGVDVRRHPYPGLVGHFWARLVDYPVAEVPYRSTGTLDMLRTMRRMLWLLKAALVLMAAVVISAVSGWVLPFWVMPAFTVVGALVVMSTVPQMELAWLSIWILQMRPKWAQVWTDLGVPLTKVSMMIGSPITREQFAAYTQRLPGRTPPDDEQEGSAQGEDDDAEFYVPLVDPRMVWAYHARGLTPDDMGEFIGLGLTAEEGLLVHDYQMTAADWRLVQSLGVPSKVPVADLARFVSWVRGSHASLHPAQFGTDTGPRSVEACLPVLRAWLSADYPRVGRLDPAARPECPAAPPAPSTSRWRRPRRRKRPNGERCPRCLGEMTPRGHRRWFANLCYERVTVGEWVETTGVLAPFFLAAGFGFEEAARLVESAEVPSVDDLVFLLAWG